jgi:hypothetical protein
MKQSPMAKQIEAKFKKANIDRTLERSKRMQ